MSDLTSYQHTVQNTATNNDCSFLKNVPQKYESSFSKAIPSPANGQQKANLAAQQHQMFASATSSRTTPLPQPDSNQAVAEDEVEDSMSDEAGLQPYANTKTMQLFAKSPQIRAIAKRYATDNQQASMKS